MVTNEATTGKVEQNRRTILFPHMIQVKVSEKNYERLKERAERNGRTMAEEVRQNLVAAEHEEEKKHAAL